MSECHLSGGFQIYGQCLTAVGFVGGTVPDKTEKDGLIELPMADVAGGAFTVGAALMGKRPIYVIRYQGFNWYNLVSVVNYACKSKELWGVPCPMMIRSIAMEGSIGPVAGSSHHSLIHRMPGINIVCPMTPSEYRSVYNEFMANDDVVYVSEHRGSYNQTKDLPDIEFDYPHFVLFPISITRFAAVEASHRLLKEGIEVSVYHQVKLKPYSVKEKWTNAIYECNGAVLDDDYTDGIASTIAHKIMMSTSGSNNNRGKVFTLGLWNRSAGFSKESDNLPPNVDEICDFVKRNM